MQNSRFRWILQSPSIVQKKGALQNGVTVILSAYYLSDSCNILIGITHLIVQKIIYSILLLSPAPPSPLTNEKTEMQRTCQGHTAIKSQCWDFIPDLQAPAFNFPSQWQVEQEDTALLSISGLLIVLSTLHQGISYISAIDRLFAPPSSHVQALSPQSDGIQRWSFGEVIIIKWGQALTAVFLLCSHIAERARVLSGSLLLAFLLFQLYWDITGI